jgi:nitrogen fixation protein NifU and related proteins
MDSGKEDIYQEFIIELYKNPLNFGKLDHPDYRADVQNSTCGDMVEIFIKTKNGVVSEARFMGKGCAISQASSSLFMGYLKGKKLDEIKKIGKDEVLKLIKIDLSKNPSRMRCALLPLEALRKAMKETH